MSEWQGNVSKTSSREFGNKTLYSWQFEGSNIWFRSEFDPLLEVGSAYTIEGEAVNKITGVHPLSTEEVKEAKQASVVSGPSGTNGTRGEAPPTKSPDYWRWKQMVDIENRKDFQRRDARRDATRLICAALDNDVLALGAAKGKKLDILLGMISETTEQLLEVQDGND